MVIAIVAVVTAFCWLGFIYHSMKILDFLIFLPLAYSSKTITKFLFVVCFGHFSYMILHPTNRLHHIPIDTIIVSIKTNTIPIITNKSITFSIVFWAGFYCFFQLGK